MKRSAGSQRITLFPFLAVLICTMGSLLVLLVVISKRAQATAETSVQQPDDAEINKIHRQREELTADMTKMQEMRRQITDYLAERRKALSHIEDHMRRLGEQIRRLQAQENQDGLQVAEKDSLESLQQELKSLDASKKELESLIKELLAKPLKKSTSYRIVPYNGANGTKRMPIYIECAADGVYFQPEGIHLTEDDFKRPLGPENPLAAGIRAQSSFLRQHRASPTESIDPYPLLIVRPSGIAAYYAARIAIRSWESEFGYELVDGEIQLDFSPPDPTLARVTQEAVNIARPRHQFMVARAREIAFRAGSRNSAEGGNGRGRMVAAGHGDDGNGFGGGTGSSAFGGPNNQGLDRPMHGSDVDRNRGALRRAEAARKAAAEARLGTLADQKNGGGSRSNHRSLSGSPGDEQAGNQEITGQRNGLSGTLSNGQVGGRSTGHVGGQGSGQGGTSADVREDNETGLSLQFGSHGNRANAPQGSPIANVRGANWALPGISQGSFPFARPIRVEISKDDITLVPTDSRQKSTVVRFEGQTREAIEQFVAAVWRYMETWGTAGRGMYWKPILNIYVAPGAENRAGELEYLLQGSGLESARPEQSPSVKQRFSRQ